MIIYAAEFEIDDPLTSSTPLNTPLNFSIETRSFHNDSSQFFLPHYQVTQPQLLERLLKDFPKQKKNCIFYQRLIEDSLNQLPLKEREQFVYYLETVLNRAGITNYLYLDNFHDFVDNFFVILQMIRPKDRERLILETGAEGGQFNPLSYLGALSYKGQLPQRKAHRPHILESFIYFVFMGLEPVHINPHKIYECQLSKYCDLKGHFRSDDICELFETLLSKITLTEPDKPNFFSAYYLYEFFPEEENPTILSREDPNYRLRIKNNARIVQRYLKNCWGYLKTLLGRHELEEAEHPGWQIYSQQTGKLKTALFEILKALNMLDESELPLPLSYLMRSLLTCPTGQKDGIDTLILYFVVQQIDLSNQIFSLNEKIEAMVLHWIGFYKETAFEDFAGTQRKNLNSVYTKTLYDFQLREVLQLHTALPQFDRLVDRPALERFPRGAQSVFEEFMATYLTPQKLTEELYSFIVQPDLFHLHRYRDHLARIKKCYESLCANNSNADDQSILIETMLRFKSQYLKQSIEYDRINGIHDNVLYASTLVKKSKKEIKYESDLQLLKANPDLVIRKKMEKLRNGKIEELQKRIDIISSIMTNQNMFGHGIRPTSNMILDYFVKHDPDRTEEIQKEYFVHDPSGGTLYIRHEGVYALLKSLGYITDDRHHNCVRWCHGSGQALSYLFKLLRGGCKNYCIQPCLGNR